MQNINLRSYFFLGNALSFQLAYILANNDKSRPHSIHRGWHLTQLICDSVTFVLMKMFNVSRWWWCEANRFSKITLPNLTRGETTGLVNCQITNLLRGIWCDTYRRHAAGICVHWCHTVFACNSCSIRQGNKENQIRTVRGRYLTSVCLSVYLKRPGGSSITKDDSVSSKAEAELFKHLGTFFNLEIWISTFYPMEQFT